MTKISVNVAADILNVSEDYVYKRIEDGVLPFNHISRLLYLSDVVEFKRKFDMESRQAMRELVRLTEEYGGYEEDTLPDASHLISWDRDRLVDDVRD